MKKKLFKTACFLMAVCLLTGTLGLNAYAKKKSRSNYTIGIDAGHQKSGNYSKEPIGPGSSDKKYKVTGGTSGKYSGLPEYRLTLQVAKKLKKEGYSFPAYYDTTGSAVSAYQIFSIPLTVGINREGEIVALYNSPVSEEQLEQMISYLLS